MVAKNEEMHISFYDQIASNKRKSALLLVVIAGFFIALAYVIGRIYVDYFFLILIAGIAFSTIYTVAGYYNSDKLALASVKAKEAKEAEYRQLHNIVEGLCLASGMPKPRIYVMPGQQINAFATGRDPKHSVVCVTQGALEKLNKQELEGIIGHELSHIASYDIRFMTIAAVLVGMIAIISELFLRSLWYSGGNNSREKGNGILMLIGIALAIFAPIATQLVQLAISRKREYVADASAVKFTRSPTGLLHALRKIRDEEPMKVPKAVASLFIANPLKPSALFSTHPPITERIKILEKM